MFIWFIFEEFAIIIAFYGGAEMIIRYGNSAAKGEDADVVQAASYLVGLAFEEETRDSALQMLSEILQRRVTPPPSVSLPERIVDALNDQKGEWGQTGFREHEIEILRKTRLTPDQVSQWRNLNVPLERFLLFTTKNFAPHWYKEIQEIYGYDSMSEKERDDFDLALISTLSEMNVLHVVAWCKEGIPIKDQPTWDKLGFSPQEAKEKHLQGIDPRTLDWVTPAEWT